MSGNRDQELVAAKQVTWRGVAAQWAVLGGLVLAVTLGGAAWTEAPRSAVTAGAGRPDVVDTETRHLQAAVAGRRIEDPHMAQLARPRVVTQGFEERDWDTRAEEPAEALLDPSHVASLLAASPMATGTATQTAQCP